MEKIMLYEQIKRLREYKNFTQQYVANRLQLSRAAYGKLERGQTKITECRLKQIATIFEVDPDVIRNLTSPENLTMNPSCSDNCPLQKIIATIWAELQALKSIVQNDNYHET